MKSRENIRESAINMVKELNSNSTSVYERPDTGLTNNNGKIIRFDPMTSPQNEGLKFNTT